VPAGLHRAHERIGAPGAMLHARDHPRWEIGQSSTIPPKRHAPRVPTLVVPRRSRKCGRVTLTTTWSSCRFAISETRSTPGGRSRSCAERSPSEPRVGQDRLGRRLAHGAGADAFDQVPGRECRHGGLRINSSGRRLRYDHHQGSRWMPMQGRNVKIASP
jgi:hypothetical protein